MEGDNAFAPTLRSLSIVATATYPDNLNASPLLCHSPSWLEASWGSLHKPSHVILGMKWVISSTGSCQVLCVSLDTTMVLRVMTPHDREGSEASSPARHEREFLSDEDEKDALVASFPACNPCAPWA